MNECIASAKTLNALRLKKAFASRSASRYRETQINRDARPTLRTHRSNSRRFCYRIIVADLLEERKNSNSHDASLKSTRHCPIETRKDPEVLYAGLIRKLCLRSRNADTTAQVETLSQTLSQTHAIVACCRASVMLANRLDWRCHVKLAHR